MSETLAMSHDIRPRCRVRASYRFAVRALTLSTSRPVILVLFVFFFASAANAQVFFAAPLAEAVYYGRQSPAILYGIALSSDDSTSIGVRVVYGKSLQDEIKLTLLEGLIFQRFYIPDFNEPKGLFVQINIGFAVFSASGGINIPTERGALSAGLSAGWRFLFGTRYFIEPYVRGGYPYYGGIGLSAGIRL